MGMSRALLLVIVVLLGLGAGPSSGSAGPRAAGPASGRPAAALPAAEVFYRAPVGARLVVVRAFRAPPGPYAAGHRGVDLATQVGEPVLAAGPGTVRFAGTVADRGVVVVAHPDGVRTEYEPVRASVVAGAAVAAGQQLGWVQGRHGACSTGECLHWGAMRDAAHFEPLLLLHPLAPVRLLPWPAS